MGCERPPLSLSAVPKLVFHYYGFNVIVVKELDSYDDRNVLVELDQSTPDHSNTNGDGHDGDNDNYVTDRKKRFLVKVINKKYSSRPDVLDLKNNLINHLNNAGFPTPGVISNLQGGYQCLISLVDTDTNEEDQFVLKMLDFTPGTTLHNVCLKLHHCHEQGQLMGRMDRIFMDFPVKDNKTIEDLYIFWNLAFFSKVKEKLHFVQDKSKLPLLEEVISAFEAKETHLNKTWSKGVIHSDINDDNTLVEQSQHAKQCSKSKENPTCHNCEEDSYKVTSLIDFGDMTYSFHIFELAIAVTYIMINTDNVDPMAAAGALTSGYLEYMTLSSDEMSHLRFFVCCRLAQSFILGQEAIANDASNQEYTQNHSSHCYPMLERLWKLSDTEYLNQITADLK